MHTYTIRRPGCTAWIEGIATVDEARAEQINAKQVTGIRHCIYEVDETGHVVGDVAETRWLEAARKQYNAQS